MPRSPIRFAIPSSRIRRVASIPRFFLMVLATSGIAAARAQEGAPAVGPPLQSLEAEESVADSTFVAENEADNLQVFPPRLYAGGLFYLPKASYSTERGLGAGISAFYPFRVSGVPLTRPASELTVDLRWTLEDQRLADVVVDLHPGNNLHLKTRLTYNDLSLRFYGIGPDAPAGNEEVYRPRSLRAYVELFRDIWSFRLGGRFEYEHVELVDTEAEGMLARRELRGTAPSAVAGSGVVFEWDRRNVTPRFGWTAEAFAIWFDEWMGSDHDFNNYYFDVRAYFDVGEPGAFGRPGSDGSSGTSTTPRTTGTPARSDPAASVMRARTPPAGEGSGTSVAVQGFIYSTRGQPPFWRYAALGGRAHTRGYRRGRYLDRTLVAFQAEYRFPLFWRLRGVGFGGMGDVAPRLAKMELEQMKPSVGAGLRFQLGESAKSRVRFDAGFGGESPRFYLAFGEAF